MPYVYFPSVVDGFSKEVWIDHAKGSDHLGKTVHEPDGKPMETGLLDKSGRKIMKHEQRYRIGFFK